MVRDPDVGFTTAKDAPGMVSALHSSQAEKSAGTSWNLKYSPANHTTLERKSPFASSSAPEIRYSVQRKNSASYFA